MPKTDIISSNYIGSFPSYKKCPEDRLPEYAFIGRSNVGKSSLINMITKRRDLAQVSKTPGKTQMINYFRINDSWNLVDLPGYGYAKRSKKHRSSFGKMIEEYFINRNYLQCGVVLIDARHPLQKVDAEFLGWLGDNHIPFVICYTKIDKLKHMERIRNIQQIQNELLQSWSELPQQFETSAVSRIGGEEILNFINEVNLKF